MKFSLVMKNGPVPLIIFSVLLGLGLLDLGLVTFGDTTVSISAWLSNVGLTSPFFCIVVGMILGHLFPMVLKRPKKGRSVWISEHHWQYYSNSNPAHAYPVKPFMPGGFEWVEFTEVMTEKN